MAKKSIWKNTTFRLVGITVILLLLMGTGFFVFTGRVIQGCIEDWDCSDWSACTIDAGNVITRTCEDSNACGTEDRKPQTERCCNRFPVPELDCDPESVSGCFDNLATGYTTCPANVRCMNEEDYETLATVGFLTIGNDVYYLPTDYAPAGGCNGYDLGGKTCQDMGFKGGQLKCHNCQFVTEGCF